MPQQVSGLFLYFYYALKFGNQKFFFLIAGVYITICLVISSASYIKIYFIVRHHQIQIHAQPQAVNSFNISVNIPDSNNMIISKKRASKTFTYYICMICCCLPYLYLIHCYEPPLS